MFKFKNRPKKEDLHMLTAYLWAQRALCKRPNKQVGCVITTSDMNQVLSIGYNGPCQQLGNDACRNESGNCGCTHAEINALAKADNTIKNRIMFITLEPCETCANMIAQSNITALYYCEEYKKHDGIMRLQMCHVILIRLYLDNKPTGDVSVGL